MKSVSIIIILCTLPAGLGVIIDRLMLNRHKGRIHDALLRYWVHLDELSFPDIWRVFAAYAIRFFTRIFGKRIRSFRCIITIILVSFCLTFCAILLGILIEIQTIGGIVKFLGLWGLIGLFFINLIFDTATGLVTAKVLSVIHHSTPAKAIALIVLDIILAYIFAIACATPPHLYFDMTLTDTVSFLAIGIIEHLVTFSSEIQSIIFFYCGTTFIPTFIYLTILATLIISKAILGIGIRFTKYFLERATEVEKSKDLAVFTLTGSFFSVIVILLTTFTMLRQAIQ
jgi:hypothetical protein